MTDTYTSLIANLDIKRESLIKGVQMEGWKKYKRSLFEFLDFYLANDIDEIIVMDAMASLYDQPIGSEVVDRIAKNSSIPIGIGGGIKTVSDADRLFDLGADRIIVNTHITRRPDFLTELAERFGCQSIIARVDCKRNHASGWAVLTENGRTVTKLGALDWITSLCSLGAGEVIIHSVDRDGTLKGPDLGLARAMIPSVDIPVVMSGGISSVEQISQLINIGVRGVAIGKALHEDILKITDLKNELIQSKARIRPGKVRS